MRSKQSGLAKQTLQLLYNNFFNYQLELTPVLLVSFKTIYYLLVLFYYSTVKDQARCRCVGSVGTSFTRPPIILCWWQQICETHVNIVFDPLVHLQLANQDKNSPPNGICLNKMAIRLSDLI